MKPSIQLKLKQFFTQDLHLKALALFFAVFLWLIGVNVENPSQTRSFTAVVTVINEEVLTEAGQYYTIPDGTATVTFRVTGKRTIVEKLTSDDFTAVADMAYLDGNKVPVTVTTSNTNVTISSQKLYITVEIGEEMTLKQTVEVDTTGDVASSCIVTATAATPNAVTITGPQEILSNLDRVVATVDVTDATDDFVVEGVVLSFLDTDGNEIDRASINVDADTADVYVTVLHTKSVNVSYTTSGELPDGVYLDEITQDISYVSIMGSVEALNRISTISIPGEALDLSSITTTTTLTVDVSGFLPEGVSVKSGTTSQVNFTVAVSGAQTQSYTVAASNISVHNLGDDLTATVDEDITVDITASKDQLAAISAATITGYVDADSLSTGSHTLQVVLDLGEEYAYSIVTATITIEEGSSSTSSTGSTSSSGNSSSTSSTGSTSSSGNSSTSGSTSSGTSGSSSTGSNSSSTTDEEED